MRLFQRFTSKVKTLVMMVVYFFRKVLGYDKFLTQKAAQKWLRTFVEEEIISEYPELGPVNIVFVSYRDWFEKPLWDYNVVFNYTGVQKDDRKRVGWANVHRDGGYKIKAQFDGIAICRVG